MTDRRTVKKFDLNQGQTTWIYRESTEPVMPVNGSPRLLGDAERLFVLHDGRFLIRLDPASGSKRWSCLLGTENLSDAPDSMAFDEKRFYCVSRQHAPRHLSGRRQADLVVLTWPARRTCPGRSR